MFIRLFCPKCAFDFAKEKREKGFSQISIDVVMPVSQLVDDGKYEVNCDAGHKSYVTLDNLKFELLFEMGLNALLDGYPREAVSSFTSSLERFYEFYWYVATAFQSTPLSEAKAAWKIVAKLSERQLGMFISAKLMMTKTSPTLLNPNKEVKLRNDVIHGGYVPTTKEATDFGNAVMVLINNDIASLRTLAPEILASTYKRLSPAWEEEDKSADLSSETNALAINGTVNILTAVDVRNPPTSKDDLRYGDVEHQFYRIRRDRQPHRLTLLDLDHANMPKI